jgi:hypothetical protein
MPEKRDKTKAASSFDSCFARLDTTTMPSGRRPPSQVPANA